MKIYIRILSSIVISLIIWSLFVGISVTTFDVVTEKINPFQNLFSPLLVAVIGLVLFGFLGSLLWTFAFVFMRNLKLPEFKKHILSASFSTLITPLVFSLLLFGQEFYDKVGLIYLMLVLIVPVVVVSLIIYRKRYIKTIT